MIPVRFYFDVPKPEDFDAHSIRIYELSSLQDTGQLIDTVRIKAGQDYIETASHTDAFSFFRLQLINADGSATLDSDVIFAEDANLRLMHLREAIKDTNQEDPGFSDDELVKKMRLAALRMNNVKNLSSIQERFWPILELLVRIDICHVLAFDFAKYQKLEIPGGPSFTKDELYDHYIRVADQLTKYYDQIKAEALGPMEHIGDGEDESPIAVSDMQRMSYVTGMTEKSLEPAFWYFNVTQNRLDEIRRLRF
jgi:hypothetical protein